MSRDFDCLFCAEYLRSISLPVPVVVEDTSSSSEYGSVSPDNDLNTNPFIFKPSVKCYSERDVKGPRSLFLRWEECACLKGAQVIVWEFKPPLFDTMLVYEHHIDKRCLYMKKF